jgi:hypothetical protein
MTYIIYDVTRKEQASKENKEYSNFPFLFPFSKNGFLTSQCPGIFCLLA